MVIKRNKSAVGMNFRNKCAHYSVPWDRIKKDLLDTINYYIGKESKDNAWNFNDMVQLHKNKTEIKSKKPTNS